MRSIIFAQQQHENDPKAIVRLSCVVPGSWIPRIDETWKETRYNNRSEFIRAAIVEKIYKHEKKLEKEI